MTFICCAFAICLRVCVCVCVRACERASARLGGREVHFFLRAQQQTSANGTEMRIRDLTWRMCKLSSRVISCAGRARWLISRKLHVWRDRRVSLKKKCSNKSICVIGRKLFFLCFCGFVCGLGCTSWSNLGDKRSVHCWRGLMCDPVNTKHSQMCSIKAPWSQQVTVVICVLGFFLPSLPPGDDPQIFWRKMRRHLAAYARWVKLWVRAWGPSGWEQGADRLGLMNGDLLPLSATQWYGYEGI